MLARGDQHRVDVASTRRRAASSRRSVRASCDCQAAELVLERGALLARAARSARVRRARVDLGSATSRPAAARARRSARRLRPRGLAVELGPGVELAGCSAPGRASPGRASSATRPRRRGRRPASCPQLVELGLGSASTLRSLTSRAPRSGGSSTRERSSFSCRLARAHLALAGHAPCRRGTPRSSRRTRGRRAGPARRAGTSRRAVLDLQVVGERVRRGRRRWRRRRTPLGDEAPVVRPSACAGRWALTQAATARVVLVGDEQRQREPAQHPLGRAAPRRVLVGDLQQLAGEGQLARPDAEFGAQPLRAVRGWLPRQVAGALAQAGELGLDRRPPRAPASVGRSRSAGSRVEGAAAAASVASYGLADLVPPGGEAGSSVDRVEPGGREQSAKTVSVLPAGVGEGARLLDLLVELADRSPPARRARRSGRVPARCGEVALSRADLRSSSTTALDQGARSRCSGEQLGSRRSVSTAARRRAGVRAARARPRARSCSSPLTSSGSRAASWSWRGATASWARVRSSKCATIVAIRPAASKGSSMWLRTNPLRLLTDFIDTVWWNSSRACSECDAEQAAVPGGRTRGSPCGPGAPPARSRRAGR